MKSGPAGGDVSFRALEGADGSIVAFRDLRGHSADVGNMVVTVGGVIVPADLFSRLPPSPEAPPTLSDVFRLRENLESIRDGVNALFASSQSPALRIANNRQFLGEFVFDATTNVVIDQLVTVVHGPDVVMPLFRLQ